MHHYFISQVVSQSNGEIWKPLNTYEKNTLILYKPDVAQHIPIPRADRNRPYRVRRDAHLLVSAGARPAGWLVMTCSSRRPEALWPPSLSHRPGSMALQWGPQTPGTGHGCRLTAMKHEDVPAMMPVEQTGAEVSSKLTERWWDG